jgi:hypothetical protein
MYDGDSLFTLSGPHQFGLVVLSAALFCLLLILSWRFSRGRSVLVRLGLSFVLFFGFVWLSPQIYYQYYRMIIDGLPAQFVVGWPHGLSHLFQLLSFQSDANLSVHSQGVLGWALVVVAAIRR